VLRSPSRRTAAAAALTLSLALTLSGCGIGFQAATTTQRASGNGANANVGDLQVRDITIVTADAGAGTIIGTIVNRGLEDDALVGVDLIDPAGKVTIGGTAAVGGALPLEAQTSTRIGYNAEDHADITGLTVSPTQYVKVRLRFKVAGTAEMLVMAVPPTGIYEGITPLSTLG
jgi:uncharacterized protein YdeI (BOF family)